MAWGSGGAGLPVGTSRTQSASDQHRPRRELGARGLCQTMQVAHTPPSERISGNETSPTPRLSRSDARPLVACAGAQVPRSRHFAPLAEGLGPLLEVCRHERKEPWSTPSSSTPCGPPRLRRAFAECSILASSVPRIHPMTHSHAVLRGTDFSERSRFWPWPGRWSPCTSCSSRRVAGTLWTCNPSPQMIQLPFMRPRVGPSAWRQGTLSRSLGQWCG